MRRREFFKLSATVPVVALAPEALATNAEPGPTVVVADSLQLADAIVDLCATDLAQCRLLGHKLTYSVNIERRIVGKGAGRVRLKPTPADVTYGGTLSGNVPGILEWSGGRRFNVRVQHGKWTPSEGHEHVDWLFDCALTSAEGELAIAAAYFDGFDVFGNWRCYSCAESNGSYVVIGGKRFDCGVCERNGRTSDRAVARWNAT